MTPHVEEEGKVAELLEVCWELHKHCNPTDKTAPRKSLQHNAPALEIPAATFISSGTVTPFRGTIFHTSSPGLFNRVKHGQCLNLACGS